ncbi:IclR family transcriptional regulator [Cnuibacter physcomitrellae]|uniref:Uncharacterized protein n=1 Tax=Cnuibacter physcomitrellae TaxID=1619308 RepID=A0A1X9LIH2_9MICO|nr:IclR family transcriptional regulator [Cnuibacter physcomitrellae]ARJ04312.1 hypothetical protein B5808_03005 [Cnuibacter physcomitrellae]GGI40744.1 IclR family transcriptional regulator [Cnuibacter physcomitrellae]
MAGNRSDARTAAQKLLAVADAFDGPGDGTLTLSDIAQRSGLPLSTTHRLVRDWVEWGGLDRDDDGRYRLGLRFFSLGVRAPTQRRMRAIARPFLDDLVDLTHQNVQLAVRDGLAALYLERRSAKGAVPIITEVGVRLPLHATGVGLVLLAHAPAEVFESVLAAGPRRYLPNTMTTEAELRPRLATVRSTGLATSLDEMTEHTYSVAAPVRGRSGEVVAAVSIVAHPDDRANREYPLAVRVAARGVSRALGWRG